MKYKILLIAIVVGLGSKAQIKELKEGDILFQDMDCHLCEAIEKVTMGYKGMNFSHCAMVVRLGDSLQLIEAVGKGVKLTGIQEFLSREGEKDEYIAGRLKPGQRHLIEGARKFALEQLEKPYDEEFLPDNDRWYCSELIHASFKQANGGEELFSLEPMTFKDPDSGEYMEAWKVYYKKLDMEIPEGVPGINPGGISRSPVLDIFTIER